MDSEYVQSWLLSFQQVMYIIALLLHGIFYKSWDFMVPNSVDANFDPSDSKEYPQRWMPLWVFFSLSNVMPGHNENTHVVNLYISYEGLLKKI